MKGAVVPKQHLDNALDMIWRLAKIMQRDKMAKLPNDVRRLVIAARVVAFEDQGPAAIKELDAASEAFADRVPWEDEPVHK